MTHICVSVLTSIGSDNGLSPGRRQAIIRTNAGILLIRPLGTNFSEFLVEILIFPFKKMRLKVLSAKRRPFCLGLNVLSSSQSPNITSSFLPREPSNWANLRLNSSFLEASLENRYNDMINSSVTVTDTMKTFGISPDRGQTLAWFWWYQTWSYTGVLLVLLIFISQCPRTDKFCGVCCHLVRPYDYINLSQLWLR